MTNLERFNERVEVVRKFLEKYPASGRCKVAEATGLSGTVVTRILRSIRGAVAASNEEPKGRPGQRTVETTPSRTAPTLSSLISECKIDLSREQIDNHIINRYEQASKHPETGVVTVTPMWQIKAWLSPIKAVQDAQIVRETIEWVRKNSPVNRKIVPEKRKNVGVDDPVMLELSIPDLHYGRLTHADETGTNYDIKIAAQIHQRAIEALYHRASVFPIQKILFVVSGDFFNVDNDKNETTAGTPQSEDSRWAKSFRCGVQVLASAVDFLRSKAEVEVRFIGGNHDRTRLFYAGEVIAAMYENTPGVVVVNQPRVRQYLKWGTVLLGLAHGDGAKHDKLPLLMASEASDLWGGTTHREVHCGHLHHSRETRFHAGNEHNAVRVRVLPSLAPVDAWHSLQGFVGQKRAAEAYLWAKKDGYLGHFSFSPTV